MIEEERYCVDIVNQIKAVRSALKSVEKSILQKHIKHCVAASFKASKT
jgi:DNA-binding FrmR family transcriptional regulator